MVTDSVQEHIDRETAEQLLWLDAIDLAHRHGGDLARLVMDRRMRLRRFAFVSADEMRQRRGDAVDAATADGLHIVSMVDGQNEILIQSWLAPERVEIVAAHELGHLRAMYLLDDHSEHMARFWADTWWCEARKLLEGRVSRLLPWPKWSGVLPPRRAIPD